MKLGISVNQQKITLVCIGITLILVANVCYYTEDTIPTYILISALGMAIIMFRYLRETHFKIKFDRFMKWISVLYCVFLIYGLLFNNGGLFNWDIYIFTYASNLVLYIAIRMIFQYDDWSSILNKPVCLTICVAMILIFTNDISGVLVTENSTRFGSSLSGNVNSVAVYFGILSLIISYYYAKSKDRLSLIMLILCFLFMLLTGSKKAIVIIACDLLMYLKVSKEKVKAFIFFMIAVIAGIILISQVPFLYNIIGHRVQDLFYQVFGIGTASYSNSSDMSSVIRQDLMTEAFDIYIKHPTFYLFGGGWNAFAANSHYHNINYYSHCNYTEMLCTYGLFGICLYYVPIIRNYSLIRKRATDKNESVFSGMILLVMLLLSFLMVIFSDTCLLYIPFMLLFLMAENAKYSLEGRKV